MTNHFPAGSVIDLTYVNGAWRRADYNTNDVPATLITTGASTAAKAGSHSYYTARANSYTLVTLRYTNTAASALTLNINGQGAKPIYINGQPSSASNYNLPAGTYLVFYNGTNYYFETDNKIRADITGDATSVNGLSVDAAVPSTARFTDTVYSFESNVFATTGTPATNPSNTVTVSLNTVSVNKGGTGVTTITSGEVLIGNGTGAITTRGIDTTNGGTNNSNKLITSNAVYQGLAGKADTGHTHTIPQISSLSGILQTGTGTFASGSSTITINLQADWEQTDSTKASFIKNKPTILNTLITIDDNAKTMFITSLIENGDGVSY